MERAEALRPLSRDHHVALELALRLRRAADPRGAADAGERLAAWRAEHARRHFRIEEDLLLPLLGDHPEHVERVRGEHVRLLADSPSEPAALRELGELLAAHVRFEERELFPLLEAELSAAELERLGREVVAAEEAA